MPRKVKSAAAVATPTSLLEKYKDFPGIKVVERRMENPTIGSIAIRLTDEKSYLDDPRGKYRKWYLRWINSAQDGRYAEVIEGMGYVPVRASELQNKDAVTGMYHGKDEEMDPIVRRGDRGSEILVKMPLELYNATKTRHRELRDRRSRNAKQVKSDLADAAGRQLGDGAGQTIQDEFSVEMRQRPTTLGEELGKEDFEEDRA